MATVQSTEMALVSSQVLVPVQKLGGRVRYAEFNYTTDGSEVVGTVIELTQLPIDAKIIGGKFTFGAMGASATFDLGILAVDDSDSDDDYFLNDLDVSSAGSSAFATLGGSSGTDAGALELLTYDAKITITTAGATLASDKAIQGYIEYVVD